jgi:hypothetical protein
VAEEASVPPNSATTKPTSDASGSGELTDTIFLKFPTRSQSAGLASAPFGETLSVPAWFVERHSQLAAHNLVSA